MIIRFDSASEYFRASFFNSSVMPRNVAVITSSMSTLFSVSDCSIITYFLSRQTCLSINKYALSAKVIAERTTRLFRPLLLNVTLRTLGREYVPNWKGFYFPLWRELIASEPNPFPNEKSAVHFWFLYHSKRWTLFTIVC